MTFRIKGLAAQPFQPLFGLSDKELAAHGAKRFVADKDFGFPDRIEMRDARAGEKLLLLNFVHQPADTPFRASHAIFVLEGAKETYDRVGEIPPVLRNRLISLRAFDEAGMMVDADVVDGQVLDQAITRMFTMPETAYLHAHYAKRGCYAARIERVL